MGESTVLVYGSRGHIALRLLYERLLQRGVRRAVFVIQERYPTELGLTFDTGNSGSSWLALDEGNLTTEDILSVAVDGFYVPHDPQLSDDDAQYTMVEGWAALVGFFYHLSGKCLVANHLTQRDYLSSRWGELCLLAGRGLNVPPALVTSDPDEARAFYTQNQGQLLCKAVTGQVFRQVQAEDVDRFDRLLMSPIHFEAAPQGWLGRLVILGNQTQQLPPGGPALPAEFRDKCLALCRELNLVFAEVSLRHHEGRWLATGLRRFLSPEVLSEVEVLDAACAVLEVP